MEPATYYTEDLVWPNLSLLMPMARKPRVLFVLKLRLESGGASTVTTSSGLYHSAEFTRQLLEDRGHVARLVQVVDNNDIDREVVWFQPDIVIVEALWVVPEKFAVLRALHPTVQWIVRLHSELPFLANEGVAMEWINGCVTQSNVYVAVNSERALRDLGAYLDTRTKKLSKKLLFLPNWYPVGTARRPARPALRSGDEVHVGCFGAMRPMKNQLIQAAAAVQYAETNGLRLRFHVNAGRTEQSGENALRNMRAFFQGLEPKHQLVEHPWLSRNEFLAVVRRMDLGMQLSFSESFNIVSADFVSQQIPMVTSKEVGWMPDLFTADPNNTASIVTAMDRAFWYDRTWAWTDWPRRALRAHCRNAAEAWTRVMAKL